MAVEANVRKRKHNNQKHDEVPKKVKKVLKINKSKQNDEDDKNALDNSEISKNGDLQDSQDTKFEERPMKFSSDFKMMDFRTKLRGKNFITELRHFLYLVERKPRIVAKYIEKRGKPLEFAEALERVNKSNLLHIGYICQALHAVLMEIVSNQPEHTDSAVNACRYFLKVHSDIIEQLLEATQIKHRRTALKLLSAIVCVDPQMGRQILAAFNILSDVHKIEQNLSHSKFAQQEGETVRKCYIHFVLSFLVDGNSVLIQNILDRSALIQALINGLLYDDQITVCLVLNTLKKYVLENTLISKTKKVHVFNLECCRNLVRLYNWLGPSVLFPKEAKNEELVNQEERELVASTVHEFLLILLTSRKFGITFDASIHLRQKHNAIQGKIIGFIQKPWSCKRKTEIVLRILKACPDLARHSVRHFSNIITLPKTGEKEYPAAVNFLSDIISIFHPNFLCNALKQLTLTDFSYWIKEICLPLETLIMLKNLDMLRHSNLDCRLSTHQLLLAMFTQYSNFMQTVMQREQAKGSGSNLRKFKFDLFNHILVHFPSVDRILNSLHITTASTDLSIDVVLRHMNVTLDLILIICKQNRSFVNRTKTILDYLKLIRPLYSGEIDSDGDDDGNQQILMLANHGDINLELKAIKTILLLHPNSLNPKMELFSHVLKSFIKGFVYGNDDDVKRESGKLLREIFKNTGIFDASVLEIDIWLEALRFSDSVTVDVVTQVFTEVFKYTQAEVDLPEDTDMEVNDANLQQLFESIEKGQSVQSYIEAFALSKLLPLISKGVELVKSLAHYIDLVSVLLFHYHPKPIYVMKLYEMNFKKPPSYMKSSLNITKHEISSFPKICEQIPFTAELQNALLKNFANTNFETVFSTDKDEKSFDLEMEQKTYKLPQLLKDERLLMIYIQQVIFIMLQLIEKEQLTHAQAELAAEYIINFLAIIYQMEQENNIDDMAYTDEGDTITKRTFLGALLSYIYDIRFGCLNSIDLCNVQSEYKLYYMHFITRITKYCSRLNDFSNFVKNFQLKIVKAIAISIETVELTKQHSNKDFIKMVEAFQLNFEHCIELLDLLCKNLKYNDFFIPIDDGFQRTFYYELLICCLNRLTELQQTVNCDEIIKSLAKYYYNFVKKLSNELNLEDFEEGFHKLLTIMHQYIPNVDCKFFACLFVDRKINKYSVKLACLLLERNDKCNEHFLSLLPDHISKKELIYPLLEVAFNKNVIIDKTLLGNIYQEYRNGFMKTIEKPQKAGNIYKEHPECSVKLIKSCMPLTECKDFCKKRFQLNDPSELYQIRLIYAIYEKTWNELENDATAERSEVFINFLNRQVQLMGVDVKRQALTKDKLDLFAYQIYNFFKMFKLNSIVHDNDFKSITKSQHWLNFCKNSLKFGMQSNEDIEDADTEHGLLLKLMAYLFDKLYADYKNTESAEINEPNEPAQVFEMICTHSKYYDIVLSTKPTQIKTAILGLLFTLAKKSPTLSLPYLEIPVILGAYHAKLTEADRYTLALLQLYEQHNPQELQKYRPFIWGESAISFYALNVSDLNERTRLTQQETTINLVMSLIEFETCDYTIDNFPIWRKLNSLEQLPIVEFRDPTKRFQYNFGANDFERHMELSWTNSKSTTIKLPASIDLRLCPKADDIFTECYDPAFFIPLMSSCFAPESYARAVRPVQNGLLALCFAALSSQDKEMRQAAGIVQLRYRANFEANKFYERPLWIQSYENIQAGLAELSENWKAKHKNHSTEYKPIPRAPYIPTLFIAKTFNIINDPTNLLYKHLTMYLSLKNTFNFQCIPEFNIFFYSAEVEHHTFRHFIIDIIRKGVKNSSDLFLLVSSNTFKVLLSFYGGAMSTLETNLLILSAFSTCVKIPASAKIMIEHVGMLPWLQSIINTLEFYHFDIIEGIITILNNLWYGITATKADFYNYNYVCMEMYDLIVSLLPFLSSRISVTRFAKLMNIMEKTASTVKDSTNALIPYTAVSEIQIDKLINCAEKHFGIHAQYLKNLKAFGGAGAGSHDAYCKQLHIQSANESAILALSSLRSFIINWWMSVH